MSLASQRLGELGDSSVSVVGWRGEPALQWKQALVEGRAGGQASEGTGPREAPKLNPWEMGPGAVSWCDRAEQGRKSGRRRGPSAAKVSRGGTGLVGGASGLRMPPPVSPGGLQGEARGEGRGPL